MPSEKQLLAEIEKYAKELAQHVADAKYWSERVSKQANQEKVEQLASADRNFKDSQQKIAESYSAEVAKAEDILAGLVQSYSLAELGWASPLWKQYHTVAGAPIPRLTRFGWMTYTGQYGNLAMPALLPIIGGRNVLIMARGAGKDNARIMLQALVLRLLGSMPPGKLRLVCIDPVGLGSTVAGFIKGLPDFLTGGQAWFNQQDIEQRLVDLENHMAFVKQKYLGVKYASMEEYNTDAGAVEEAYRLLIISDFPARFSDTAVQRLISIATNGPSTGVYILAMVDMEAKMPYGFNLEDLKRPSTLLQLEKDRCVWLDPDFKDCSIELDGVPPAQEFETIVKEIHSAALRASDVRVPYTTFVPQKNRWWQEDSRAGVETPIGQFGARETQHFILNESLLSSALVVGKTGSGKSTLLHILINGLAINYSPEEVELYLLDFKQVEFKDYGIYQLPHARVVAVKSEREFGLSVLRGLDAELQRRKDAFGNMKSLSEYRTKTGKKLPRILMIADEFQELFSYDDNLASEAALILDRLVRQGRAFGVNVLLASQTLAGPNALATATKNQIPVRVALQCSETDSRLILSDENDQARLLERPGEAIYNAKNGLVEGNRRFQVAWLTDMDRVDFLNHLRRLADEQPDLQNKTPIVFDGDSPAELSNNLELMNLLQLPDWPKTRRGFAVSAWLGEPIEIKAHTAASIRRQSRANLLIIGQNQREEDTLAMLLSSWIGLVAQQNPQQARFVVFNLADVDSPWYEIPIAVADKLARSDGGYMCQVIKRRSVLNALEEVYNEVQHRLEQGDEASYPSLYLYILGLHRARDLRRDDLGSSFAPYTSQYDSDGNYIEQTPRVSPAEQLAKICREGPDVGVHTLMWCDTYANLERVLERREITDFGLRVAMQMSADDSRSLIDSEAATKLGNHRALFYDEEHSGRLEKFRPYGLPSIEKLQDWAKFLIGRTSQMGG